MAVPRVAVESSEEKSKDTVEELLYNKDDVSKLMKMERRLDTEGLGHQERWFPYLDKVKAGSMYLSSSEILEAVTPYIMDSRKERFRHAVKNRTYSVCLVVEGLSDFGNVSATFRSADALGIQSVHVVACDSSKRCSALLGTGRIDMSAWELRNGWISNYGILFMSASQF